MKKVITSAFTNDRQPARAAKLLKVGTLACTAAALLLGLTSLSANAAAYYSKTGAGPMGDVTTWGDSSGLTDGDTSNDSVILEVFFDFTPAADAEDGALLIWEIGDTSGSSLTIKGDNLLFSSRHSNTSENVSAAHGLTAPQAGVQVVTVINLADTGVGANTSTVYVNGSAIGSGAKTQNDWAGGNDAELGFSSSSLNEVGARPHTFVTDWGTISNYPDAASANFSFNAYLLGGPGNDLGSILVPEPGSLALLGLGGLCVLRRRHG